MDNERRQKMAKVGIVMGSDSDMPVMAKAAELISREDTLLITDPVMADNGRLYKGFAEDFPSQMLGLCRRADIITPNITEAAFMLGTEYRDAPYTEEYIRGLISGRTRETVKEGRHIAARDARVGTEGAVSPAGRNAILFQPANVLMMIRRLEHINETIEPHPFPPIWHRRKSIHVNGCRHPRYTPPTCILPTLYSRRSSE